MNTRKAKIELLKAIRNGSIKPEDLPARPIVIADTQQIWPAMLAMADLQEGQPNSFIFVGEAKYVLQQWETELNQLSEKYRNEDESIA
jgi:hypothetical protein